MEAPFDINSDAAPHPRHVGDASRSRHEEAQIQLPNDKGKAVELLRPAMATFKKLGDLNGSQMAEEVLQRATAVPVARPVEPTSTSDVAALTGMPEQVVSKKLERHSVRSLIMDLAKDAVASEDSTECWGVLMDMGMDSLTSVAFRNDLSNRFQLDLPASLIFEYPSVGELTKLVVSMSEQSISGGVWTGGLSRSSTVTGPTGGAASGAVVPSASTDALKDFFQTCTGLTSLCGFMVVFCWVVIDSELADESILIGGCLTVVGLGLFGLGVRFGLMPLSEEVGRALLEKTSKQVVYILVFLLGFLCNATEPTVWSLSATVRQLYSSQGALSLGARRMVMLTDHPVVTLFWLSVSVGLATLLGCARLMYKLNIKKVIFGVTTGMLVFTIACANITGSLPAVAGFAWDMAAGTSGAVSSPILLGLGIGMSSRDRRRLSDQEDGGSAWSAGFGVLAFSVLLPVATMWLVTMGMGEGEDTMFGDKTMGLGPLAQTARGGRLPKPKRFEEVLATSWATASCTLGPISGLLLLIHFVLFYRELGTLPELSTILLSLAACFLGIAIFTMGFSVMSSTWAGLSEEMLQGVEPNRSTWHILAWDSCLEMGLVPLGDRAALQLAHAKYIYLAPEDPRPLTCLIVISSYGFFVGVFAAWCEPQLKTLVKTVESLSGDTFERDTWPKASLTRLQIFQRKGRHRAELGHDGRSLKATSQKVHRKQQVFCIDVILMPCLPLVDVLSVGYTLCLLLTLIADEATVAIAWDTAGLTTGPVMVPLLSRSGLRFVSYGWPPEECFGIVSCVTLGAVCSVLSNGVIRSQAVHLGRSRSSTWTDAGRHARTGERPAGRSKGSKEGCKTRRDSHQRHGNAGKGKGGKGVKGGCPPSSDEIPEARREELRAELEEFVASESKQLQMPTSITGLERKFLHEQAELRSLTTQSFGQGRERYLCIFKQEQAVIEEAAPARGIPARWKMYGDHMTICLGPLSDPTTEDFRSVAETVQKQISRYQETGIERERDAKNPCFAHDAKEQQRFELQVVSLGHNDDAIAVGVIGCTSCNRNPHITVATAPQIPPNASNMIKKWTMLPSTEQLTLVGHLKQLGAGDARAQRAAPAAAAGAPEAEPAAEVEAEVTEESFASHSWHGRRFKLGCVDGSDAVDWFGVGPPPGYSTRGDLLDREDKAVCCGGELFSPRDVVNPLTLPGGVTVPQAYVYTFRLAEGPPCYAPSHSRFAFLPLEGNTRSPKTKVSGAEKDEKDCCYGMYHMEKKQGQDYYTYWMDGTCAAYLHSVCSLDSF
eukprot:g17329.t1